MPVSEREKSDITKTLVLRLSSIGDIILMTPFLRALRRALPDARIDVAVRTEYAELLRHHPELDTVHEIDISRGAAGLREWNSRLRAQGYDAVYDLHNSLRTRMLRRRLAPRIRIVQKRSLRRFMLVAARVNLLRAVPPVPERYIACGAAEGLRSDGSGADIFLTVDEENRAAAWASSAIPGDGPLIGICPGARHATKRWPLEHFLSLCRRLLDNTDARMVVLGGPDDAPAGARLAELDPLRIVTRCGEATLLETSALMRHCAVIVANDSGLMHMAGASGVPVIALFGSTVREFGFFPYNCISVVHEVAGLSCRPCTHIGRADCPRGHFRCMMDIDAESVFASVRGFLSKSGWDARP